MTTAKALDAATTKEVEAALAGHLKAGQKSLITYKASFERLLYLNKNLVCFVLTSD